MRFIFSLATSLMYAGVLLAQSVEVDAYRPLSPAESRAELFNIDLHRIGMREAAAQPVFTHIDNVAVHSRDTTAQPRGVPATNLRFGEGCLRGIVYAGTAASKSTGDFLPYQGNGASGWRGGGYGEVYLKDYGTLSGRLQYSEGRHRNIGWSAMRLPELYLPYISTDSIGGDFKYHSYQAMGRYGFSLSRLSLAAELDFQGEQAWRLTDPRALNNTVWLRPSVGAGMKVGRVLLMASAGYGRNKQHVSLRYWRPGEQDRFFVAYGFGLYDTRQSGVSFSKSRMYYIDEWRGSLLACGTLTSRLSFQAGINYANRYMTTEESDIYNLYESRTNILSGHASLKYRPTRALSLDLWAQGEAELRKGYENIIEEYLIDKQNNIYDFRTLDTQQNYKRDIYWALAALRLGLQWGTLNLGLQGGLRYSGYKEKYQGGIYSISITRLQPHARVEICNDRGRNLLSVAAQYTWQRVGSHHYDVDMGKPSSMAGAGETPQKSGIFGDHVANIGHLDFQHAFAPYAYRAANTGTLSAELRFEHRFAGFDVGVLCQGFLTHGRRKRSVAYGAPEQSGALEWGAANTGTPSFLSSAPMVSPQPDRHNERYGTATLYLRF